MTNQTTVKRDVQKLQRAIVDGLEDVKALDIRVFNTEHLSPLFERVIVAAGTSNRQTRALAFAVVDAVREAGFPKPRMEGQENGEWIIVDCGAAVAHVMQPAIRQYYQLEEIWGDKPVRLKLGAPLPAGAAASSSAAATAAKESALASKAAASYPSAGRAPARKSATAAAGKGKAVPKRPATRGAAVPAGPARRAAARKPASAKAPARGALDKKTPARKRPARRA
jgi:ribosome-associated protein